MNMGYKNKDGDFGMERYDDLYSGELDVLADESRTAQVASYKNVNVDTTTTAIQTSASKFIKNIVGIYHKTAKKVDDFYIDDEDKSETESELESVISSIADIESMNLVMLLKQVKWGDHLVETLMRRLEAGGNMDGALIEQIMAAQASSLNLTLTISSYVRNIPTYFKHLKNDLLNNPQDGDHGRMLSMDDTSGMLQLEAVSHDNEPLNKSSEFDIAVPQRGMKDLINKVNKAKSEAALANKSVDDGLIDFEEIKGS